MENKKVLTVIERANKNLIAAQQASEKATEQAQKDLAELTAAEAKVAEAIEVKNDELATLNAQYAMQLREQQAELAMRVKENSEEVLEELLAQFGLARISGEDLQELANAKKEAESNLETAVEEAVIAKAATLNSVHASAMKEAGYKHDLASAELQAQVEALRKENAFLVAQLHEARGNLAAEREARIQIAASEAQRQGVTVNTGK